MRELAYYMVENEESSVRLLKRACVKVSEVLSAVEISLAMPKGRRMGSG